MKFPVLISIVILISALPACSREDGTANTPEPSEKSLNETVEAELGEKKSKQAYPCEHRDEFSEFDFWLGEWDVHTANGSFAGKNRIEKAQAGCVLIENWVSVTGVPGMSMNYFDISSNEWVQVWIGAGGTQIVIRGGLGDEGLLLEGQINYVANGTSAPFRGLWTPLPDGRVRQFFEQSNDGGENWVPWFEGFYTRTTTEQQVSEK